MFETARESVLYAEQNKDTIKEMILLMLKDRKVSLSQTRALFHEIINDIEDAPLK
ncbi:hypothetical protein SAMN05443270_3001 [Lacrimispora sphenoides]|uniref:hypothetical protein n=1 Tax=Lacrimispora sphenoides TaxID=29370 RepID=UPI0008D438C4|nr:hypothetical protein [Lacrimispora sphenoides]SEU08115.1 hypothetical protein SAMN05443270_3001 [Lacrimispora sphenoides]